MSFDLAVLAMDASADSAAAGAMYERCCSDNHPEGELDERIVGFYETLRARFSDQAPYSPESPWMSMPLGLGIDHVITHLSFSSRSDAALAAIQELAVEYGLVLWDPQSGDAHMPQA